MNRIKVFLLLNLAALLVGFSYTGSGSNGFVTGETVTADNMNELDTELDKIASVSALETAWGSVNIILATEIDTLAELNAILGDGNFQTEDADLTTIAGLTATSGNVMFAAGSAWTSDATPAINCTDCTGTAASLTAGTANAGDSATAFFSSGTIEVARGGTGAGSFTSNAVLLGNGTSAIAASVVTIASGAVDGVTTLDADGAVTATSITADAAAAPSVTFDDSVAAGTESQITADATADNNGTLIFDVEQASADYYSAIEVRSTAGAVTVRLGGDVGANYIQVAEGGVLTGEGTATIEAAALTGSMDIGTSTVRSAVCNERDTAANIATGFGAGDMENCWFYIVSGTDTINLPAITADGQRACFYAIGANAITINPDNNDQIRAADGVLDGIGEQIASGATAGSFGCFMSSNSSGTDDEWILLESRGTWTAGS